jgi:hypothetical protein
VAVKNIAAPLPDVTLLPGSTVEVDAGAGGTVTGLVIHGFQIQPPPGSKPTVRLPGLSGDSPLGRTTQSAGSASGWPTLQPGAGTVIGGEALGPYLRDESGSQHYYWQPDAARVPSFGGIVIVTRIDGSYTVQLPSGETNDYWAPGYVQP